MIGFDEFLSALIIAALVLFVISIPKLFIYLIWTIYKFLVYSFSDRLLRTKHMKNVLPERIYSMLLETSEDPSTSLQNQLKTFEDYKDFVTEPLIEACSSLILIFFISVYVPLAPQVEQIFLWLVITLIIIIALSLAMVFVVIKRANQLMTLQENIKK